MGEKTMVYNADPFEHKALYVPPHNEGKNCWSIIIGIMRAQTKYTLTYRPKLLNSRLSKSWAYGKSQDKKKPTEQAGGVNDVTKGMSD